MRYVMFGNMRYATIENQLPDITKEDGTRSSVFILACDQELLDEYGVDLRVQGVDRFGKPGGSFIRREYPVLYIMQEEHRESYSWLFIRTDFNGGKTAHTNLANSYDELALSYLKENIALKTFLRRVMKEYQNIADSDFTLINRMQQLAGVRKVSGPESQETKIDSQGEEDGTGLNK